MLRLAIKRLTTGDARLSTIARHALSAVHSRTISDEQLSTPIIVRSIHGKHAFILHYLRQSQSAKRGAGSETRHAQT